MSLEYWVLSYALNALFWAWIIFFDGAERLEGGFASALFVSSFAPNWSAAGIRLFSWLTLTASTILFLAGLFRPELRHGL
jgi:hypothetical protein